MQKHGQHNHAPNDSFNQSLTTIFSNPNSTSSSNSNLARISRSHSSISNLDSSQSSRLVQQPNIETNMNHPYQRTTTPSSLSSNSSNSSSPFASHSKLKSKSFNSNVNAQFGNPSGYRNNKADYIQATPVASKTDIQHTIDNDTTIDQDNIKGQSAHFPTHLRHASGHQRSSTISYTNSTPIRDDDFTDYTGFSNLNNRILAQKAGKAQSECDFNGDEFDDEDDDFRYPIGHDNLTTTSMIMPGGKSTRRRHTHQFGNGSSLSNNNRQSFQSHHRQLSGSTRVNGSTARSISLRRGQLSTLPTSNAAIPTTSSLGNQLTSTPPISSNMRRSRSQRYSLNLENLPGDYLSTRNSPLTQSTLSSIKQDLLGDNDTTMNQQNFSSLGYSKASSAGSTVLWDDLEAAKERLRQMKLNHGINTPNSSNNTTPRAPPSSSNPASPIRSSVRSFKRESPVSVTYPPPPASSTPSNIRQQSGSRNRLSRQLSHSSLDRISRSGTPDLASPPPSTSSGFGRESPINLLKQNNNHNRNLSRTRTNETPSNTHKASNLMSSGRRNSNVAFETKHYSQQTPAERHLAEVVESAKKSRIDVQMTGASSNNGNLYLMVYMLERTGYDLLAVYPKIRQSQAENDDSDLEILVNSSHNLRRGSTDGEFGANSGSNSPAIEALDRSALSMAGFIIQFLGQHCPTSSRYISNLGSNSLQDDDNLSQPPSPQLPVYDTFPIPQYSNQKSRSSNSSPFQKLSNAAGTGGMSSSSSNSNINNSILNSTSFRRSVTPKINKNNSNSNNMSNNKSHGILQYDRQSNNTLMSPQRTTTTTTTEEQQQDDNIMLPLPVQQSPFSPTFSEYLKSPTTINSNLRLSPSQLMSNNNETVAATATAVANKKLDLDKLEKEKLDRIEMLQKLEREHIQRLEMLQNYERSTKKE